MSEEVVEATPSETQSEPSVVVSEPPAAPEQPQPEPKKRGRPPGAKDAVKRTRKPVVKLRVEPVVRDPPLQRLRLLLLLLLCQLRLRSPLKLPLYR